MLIFRLHWWFRVVGRICPAVVKMPFINLESNLAASCFSEDFLKKLCSTAAAALGKPEDVSTVQPLNVKAAVCLLKYSWWTLDLLSSCAHERQYVTCASVQDSGSLCSYDVNRAFPAHPAGPHARSHRTTCQAPGSFLLID